MSKRTPQESGKNSLITRLSASTVFTGTGLLIVLIIVIFVLDGDSVDSVPQQPIVMTTDPQIILNLTAFPQATALSGTEAELWNDFRMMVAGCAAYSPERRVQMEQHIEWLLDPSDMPPNVILAMGRNPTERLIFGMATYTSIQWRIDGRLPDSCLVPIGLALNDMLDALGTEPFDIYNEVTVGGT